MHIDGNKIIYKDHCVVCDPNVIFDGYIEEMAERLSVEGDVNTHDNELQALNNDGSWTIRRNWRK